MNNHHLTTKMLFSNSQQQLPDFWLLAKSDSFLQKKKFNFFEKEKESNASLLPLAFFIRKKIG